MPAIDVIEDYTKRRLRITPQGWEAELGWTVAYAPSAMAAIQQASIPIINAAHPQNALLTCQWVGLEEYNFNLSRVRALYRQLNGPTTDDTDPLHQPPVMKFGRGSRSMPSDRDALNNLIANSAGDPFTGRHRTFPLRTFTITRNEPFWDPRIDAQYGDTVNSAPFSPLGLPALGPGQCHLLSILPGTALMRGMRYVPIIYSFEYDAGENLINFQGVGRLWDSFMSINLDLGLMGWFPGANGPARGQFVDASNRPLSNPVRLDGTGVPVDSSIKVRDPVSGTVYDPIQTPQASDPKGARIVLDNPPAIRMVYPELKVADFNTFRF